MKAIFLIFYLSLASAFILLGSARADGSIDTSEVMPLLKQDTNLYNFVVATFDLIGTAWAPRIGSIINEDLGGARIAPYSIRAKRKGSKGDWEFILYIDAETSYYNAIGKVVSLEEGKSIKEKLIGIRLVSIHSKNTEQDAAANP